MAVFVKQEEKRINWFVTGGISFAFLIMIVGTYYLFFAPVPLIATFQPAQLKQNEEVATIDISPAARKPIEDFVSTGKLRAHIAPLSIIESDFGQKENPFKAF